MCNFKSGIILKNKVVVAPAANDSHSDLLESLNIADTMENAMRVFVRAELLPPNNEWWTDPDTWKVKIDQDIVPDWFETDKEKYLDEFKTAVKTWWSEHVLVDKKIDKLTSGYYRLKRCEVRKLCKDVQVMCDSSTVQVMCDSSTVQRMYGSSTVQRMYDSSTVREMYGSSTVQVMYDSSIARDIANKRFLISEQCDYEIIKKQSEALE